MRNNSKAIFIALTIALIITTSGAQSVVGKATIRAPAVILGNNTGSLTQINLTVYKGSGVVTVTGAAVIGNSTTQSALTAAKYATQYLNLNYSKYNFTYTVFKGGQNVSGPSAGAAMTLLAISALSGKPLNSNFSITGTISSAGVIGPIGGVYDKASAVKGGNLTYFMVPKVQNGSIDNELYLLVQDTFNLPVIEVGSISQAYSLAFNKPNIRANITNYTFYSGPNVNRLQAAPITCSNNCNLAPFNNIVNFTFSYTNSSINALSSAPGFKNVVYQLHNALTQYRIIASKGYLYAGANFAFTNYVDSFYFNSYKTSESFGFATLRNIQNYCSSIAPPQITNSNYEYVIGGELRQSWAEYTINSTMGIYNSSVQTTDDVLGAMKGAAGANGWCTAASEMYRVANASGGTNMIPNSALSNMAYNRVSRAQPYPGMYLSTAEEAFAVNNYPLAIIGADYAYSIANATQQSQTFTTAQLLNISDKLARNSTYGVWATQFGNEAELYIQQSAMTTNQSQAHDYATSAYSSALLASQLSMDIRVINQNLIPGNGTPTIGTMNNQSISNSTNSTTPDVTYLVSTTHQIFVIAVVMLVINIVLFFIILYLLLPTTKASRAQLSRPQNTIVRKRKRLY